MTDAKTIVIDQAITLLELTVDEIIADEAAITLPQFRRLKTIRHRLSDFLVVAVKADEKVLMPERGD